MQIGFGSEMPALFVRLILSPSNPRAPGRSAPLKRLVDQAREQGRLVDATYGRRTRSIIITDAHQVVLSNVGVETLRPRCQEELRRHAPFLVETVSEG